MEGERLLERILDGIEDPRDLPLQLLKDITNDFSEERKIGQGGFGAVYKGVLGKRIVAVKRIHIGVHTIDDKLFHREVTSLMKSNHINVVRFLGVCSQEYQKPIEEDGSGKYIWANVLERLLCFEYISNGSLDKHITDELRGFEWDTRYEIIIGICKGLSYLHKEKKIIHMDLKPENILLDHQDRKYMVPKITDFGLSRPNKYSHTVGICFGTLEYLAPEYREESKTTHACDIYSLGLIIIELVTGCKDIPDGNNVLRRWRHRWNKPPTQLQYQQVTRCIYIAERCRDKKPEARPSISKIISYLSESKSTQCKIRPCLYEDDMLGIKPLKLQMPSELKEDKSFSLELKNDTGNRVAFNIKLPSPERYSAQPDKGIVQPGSKYDVNITVHPQDMHQCEKLTVQSMKDTEGLRDEDVTGHMFEEAGKVLDEVDLMVVYEPTKRQENCKRREDTDTLSEEAHKAKQRKIDESTSEKGKLDRSESREAPSMDISSSARGQYTKQLDRRNFHPPENFSHSQATNMTYLVRDSDRAMDVTRGAMGSLLHKLGELHEEFNLETSVKEDVDSLSEELMKMQPVLRKVSEAQHDNLDDMVKRWASNVREMSYDLEDFVDGFLVNSEPDSDRSGVRELTHEMCFPLEKDKSHQPIGDLIKHHVSKQVQDAAKKCKEYKVDNIVPNASAKAALDDFRNLAIHKDKEELIGIETPIGELIDLLEEGGDVSSQNFKIVSIVGLGGLGKTTLANAVYKEFKGQCKTRAFVSVGQNPDVKKVLKKIISEIEKDVDDDKSKKDVDVHQLIQKLNELLKNKRYFIVIDDLWDSEGSLPSEKKEAWDFIRCAFPKNNHGSRVITTTRNNDVALACCNLEPKYVYRIKPLSKEESKKLFFRKAFGPGSDCPDTLKDISDDILKRCGGMPLAINSIASRLAGKTDSTWEYVRKSLGGLTEGNDLGNMKRILDLSYIHLPDHLKTCLLHVCMYPEDYEIDKGDLLRQWVAEGYVCAKGQLDAEDVAENNFKALISMCMIEPWKIDYNNEVLSCRVHDIILDLIRSKSSEEKFIHVIDSLKDVSGQIRRVSVQYSDKEDGRILETIKGSLSHARSVLLYRHLLLPDFLKYKYVRVLHLEDDAFTRGLDLTAISSLFLLRYLKIACRKYSSGELKLPDKIGQLQQLETIDLQGGELNNYPSDIVTLPQLSHLRYSGWIGLILPDGIERLKSLHTLEGVCVGQNSVETIKGLGELTNLRNLGICLDFTSESEEVASALLNALCSSISRLSTSLRILTLNAGLFQQHDLSRCTRILFPPGSRIQKLHLSGCKFQRCPVWIGQLHYLYSLRIEVREVADGFSIVGGLPSLAYFELSVDVLSEESVVIPSSGAFQALKHLIVHSRNTLLTFKERAMPKLQKFGIAFHRRGLEYMPVGIEHLPASSLKEISITMSIIQDKWKVKGSEHWKGRAWEKYWESVHYKEKIEERNTKMETLLKRAFKSPFPSADIYIDYADYNYSHSEYFNEKQGEDAYDDEDYYNEEDDEDWYSSEEDDESADDEEADEGAYQVNGSQTSAQVQTNTRQLVGLMEVQEDSGRMSINTDAPLMVHTSVDLAVGSEGQQGRRGSQDLAILEYSQLLTGLLAPLPPSLPPFTWPGTVEPMANFPVDINNNLAVQQGNNGMLVNAVEQCLDIIQAPTSGHVDLNLAPNQLNDEELLPSGTEEHELFKLYTCCV